MCILYIELCSLEVFTRILRLLESRIGALDRLKLHRPRTEPRFSFLIHQFGAAFGALSLRPESLHRHIPALFEKAEETLQPGVYLWIIRPPSAMEASRKSWQVENPERQSDGRSKLHSVTFQSLQLVSLFPRVHAPRIHQLTTTHYHRPENQPAPNSFTIPSQVWTHSMLFQVHKFFSTRTHPQGSRRSVLSIKHSVER